MKKYAIKKTATPDISVTSSITTDDSAADIDQCFANCGLHQAFDEVLKEIEFGLIHQVSLHINADICGILNNINGDSGTIRTDCSNVTLASSKSLLPTPINYHIPIKIPNSSPNKDTTMTIADSTDEDPISSNITTTTPSDEEAPDNRLKGSNNN